MKNLKFPLLFLVFAVIAAAVVFTACKDDDTDVVAKNEFSIDGVTTELHPAVYFRHSAAESSEYPATGIILMTTNDLVITPAQTESESATFNGSGCMVVLMIAAPTGTTDWTHTYTLTEEDSDWAFNGAIMGLKNATSEMGDDFEKAMEWGGEFKSGTLSLKTIGENEYEITLSGVCAKNPVDGTAPSDLNVTLKYKGKVLNQPVGIGSGI